MTDKVCYSCKENKVFSEFNKNKRNKDGYSRLCRVCDKASARGQKYKEKTKRYQENNKERLQAYGKEFHYKNKYGLSLEQLDQMRVEQNYCCFICGIHEDRTHREILCVDHDHETGQVRKLLCSKCNQGLGLFNDSASLLAKSAAYLESYGKP